MFHMFHVSWHETHTGKKEKTNRCWTWMESVCENWRQGDLWLHCLSVHPVPSCGHKPCRVVSRNSQRLVCFASGITVPNFSGSCEVESFVGGLLHPCCNMCIHAFGEFLLLVFDRSLEFLLHVLHLFSHALDLLPFFRVESLELVQRLVVHSVHVFCAAMLLQTLVEVSIFLSHGCQLETKIGAVCTLEGFRWGTWVGGSHWLVAVMNTTTASSTGRCHTQEPSHTGPCSHEEGVQEVAN